MVRPATHKTRIGDHAVGQPARGEVPARQVGQGLITRQCPVTCGLPTRMTATAWEHSCRRQRDKAAGTPADMSTTGGFAHKTGGYCLVCQGKSQPAELEIIERTQIMGEEMRKGACDGCGLKKSTSMCSGKLLCSSCAAVAGTVSNRPDALVRMVVLRNQGENVLRGLLETMEPGQVATVLDQNVGIGLTVESSALKAIAEMVGYTGTDGDALLEAVAVATSASGGQQQRIEVLAEELELAHERLKGLDDTMDALREILEIPEDVAVVDAVRDLADDWRGMLVADEWKPSPDTIRALGLPEGTTSWSPVELAAMQIAARLEDTERELHQTVVEYEEAIDAQFQAIGRVAGAASVGTDGLGSIGIADKIIEAIAQFGHGMEQMRSKLEAACYDTDQVRKRLDSANETIENLRHIVAAVCAELRVHGIDLEEIPDHVAELRHRAESGATLTTTLEQAIDPNPHTQALADFALRVLAGKVALTHCGQGVA